MAPKFKNTVLLLVSAFALMFFALFDNFPILTADTGSYINSGFTLKPPVDRPIFYGLFIRATSLGASLWLTIFIQCLILAYTLLKFLKKAIPRISNLHLLVFIIFVSFFTIGGWFVSQLMPDIFVSIMILSATNYLIFENSRNENISLIGIIFLSVLTHNSNYVIITIVATLLVAGSFFIIALKVFRKKTFVLLVIGITSWISLCTSNFIGGNGFTTSNSTHVFIMGKLVESGILKIYLEKACPIKPYKICKYKENLPVVAWEFHWDAPSPVQKEGGWEANRVEYNAIIADIFSRPKYYPLIIYKSLEATARQLVLTNIDGNYSLPWAVFDDGTAPFEAVEKYFPHELNQLKTSRQNIKTFNIPFYNSFFFIIILITLMGGLLVFDFKIAEYNYMVRIFLVFIFFIILNAFATAILSSVNERFNSRVVWLIPFFNFIIIYKYCTHRLFSNKKKLN